MLDATKQRIILWFAIIQVALYGIAVGVFCRFIPPPDAAWSVDQIAHFYREKHGQILIGAMIAGWTSGFQIPFGVVFASQVARVERGKKIWASLVLTSGTLTTIFFAIPLICWGTAAFTPERAPEVTALMHQLGTLTFVTTTQLYIGAWLTIAIICFLKPDKKHSPFPRWWGYATIWTIIIFEVGPIAFLTKHGPFAWNGILVFWATFLVYAIWIVVQCNLVFRALRAQQNEEEETANANGARAVVQKSPPAVSHPGR